ncbi:MAG: gephyrin-like molybdotransferase Glp [Bacteroidota bacterium]
MIDFDDALAIVLAESAVLGTTIKPLSRVTGEILAEDITAKNPMPPFDSSSMDGYAIRSADIANADVGHPVTLSVAGTIHAGEAADTAVKRRSAIKIMTGAPIPRGADAVIMKELVTETDSGIEISTPIRSGTSIRRRGAEFKKGAVVLLSGTLITPPVAGLLASAGCARVRVFKKPRVSLVVTGDEVRPVTAELKAGQIRDSNSTALSSALNMLGVSEVRMTRAADAPAQISQVIGEALRSSDIVITVGGISVGDHDYVREALHSLRVKEHFWRIAMKPGKPNFFGTKGKKLIFALPGNPVSALLSFHLLIRPAIARMTGQSLPEPLIIHARLTGDLKKQAGRMEFVRVRISKDGKGGFIVAPLRGQESHMLSGLASANGIYRFPKSATSVQRNRSIAVELINWWWS